MTCIHTRDDERFMADALVAPSLDELETSWPPRLFLLALYGIATHRHELQRWRGQETPAERDVQPYLDRFGPPHDALVAAFADYRRKDTLKNYLRPGYYSHVFWTYAIRAMLVAPAAERERVRWLFWQVLAQWSYLLHAQHERSHKLSPRPPGERETLDRQLAAVRMYAAAHHHPQGYFLTCATA